MYIVFLILFYSVLLVTPQSDRRIPGLDLAEKDIKKEGREVVVGGDQPQPSHDKESKSQPGGTNVMLKSLGKIVDQLKALRSSSSMTSTNENNRREEEEEEDAGYTDTKNKMAALLENESDSDEDNKGNNQQAMEDKREGVEEEEARDFDGFKRPYSTGWNKNINQSMNLFTPQEQGRRPHPPSRAPYPPSRPPPPHPPLRSPRPPPPHSYPPPTRQPHQFPRPLTPKFPPRERKPLYNPDVFPVPPRYGDGEPRPDLPQLKRPHPLNDPYPAEHYQSRPQAFPRPHPPPPRPHPLPASYDDDDYFSERQPQAHYEQDYGNPEMRYLHERLQRGLEYERSQRALERSKGLERSQTPLEYERSLEDTEYEKSLSGSGYERLQRALEYERSQKPPNYERSYDASNYERSLSGPGYERSQGYGRSADFQASQVFNKKAADLSHQKSAQTQRASDYWDSPRTQRSSSLLENMQSVDYGHGKGTVDSSSSTELEGYNTVQEGEGGGGVGQVSLPPLLNYALSKLYLTFTMYI